MSLGKAKIRVRPGLLDRLKRNSGITSDEAFASLIGVGRATLHEVRSEAREPSLGFAVGVANAFGLGVSEVIEWEYPESKGVEDDEAA